MILQTPCYLGQNTPLLKTPSYYRHPANADTHYYGNPGTTTNTLLLRTTFLQGHPLIRKPCYYGYPAITDTLLLWTPTITFHPAIMDAHYTPLLRSPYHITLPYYPTILPYHIKHPVSTYHRYYKPLDIKDTLLLRIDPKETKSRRKSMKPEFLNKAQLTK